MSFQPPAVTVLIPVYNAAAYLAEALDSVLAQKGVDFEILIGDNASTDQSVELIRAYRDPRIRLLTSEKNLGIYGNLTRLFAAAQAPLVKILCADDYLLPGGLAQQVAFMRNHPELAFSRCLGQGDLAARAKRFPLNMELSLPVIIRPPAALLAFATFGCLVGNLTQAIVRPGLLGQELRFDLGLPYAGDYEFWARLARSFPFGLQNEELVYVRAHPQQSSFTLNRKNELVAQINTLFARFNVQIDSQLGLHKVLRWHWALVFVSQQWNKGVRGLLGGNVDAFRACIVPRSFTYNNFFTFLVYMVSLEGRFGQGPSFERLNAEIKRLNITADSATLPPNSSYGN